jgi:type IV pilus assembly protein PilF
MRRAVRLGCIGIAVCMVFAACGPTLEERKKRAETQYEIGVAELNNGNLTEAFEALQAAKNIYDNDPRFYNGLGLIYLQQRQYDEAVEAFTKTLQIDGNFTEARNNLGTTYAQMRKWDEAIVQFREAVNDPFYRTPELAYYNLGSALMEKGELIEAVKELHMAVELRPDFSRALDKYGVSLFRLNRVQEAVKQFQKAFELDPAFIEPHLNLGLAYMKQGKKEDAIKEFKFVIENSNDANLVDSAKRYLEILE